ncbi:ATP-binding cassette domain-containing protein [Nonomuraea sp. NPDC050328]|uniref:ABC transporter ATP-binding protein n=1 Tax=Nonomuraea sp. NPDC050328 TaxID=3364361 RepID=UPI0037A497B1
MIVAKDLAVAGVYEGVSFVAEPGSLTAVVGPGGSGRTSLLLTLAGRMKPSAGQLSVAGVERRRAIRKVAALALVDGVTDFDRRLTVREHLRERGRQPYQQVLERVGFTAGDRTPVGELDREGQVRLGLALALLDRPKVIVADNVDVGLPESGRAAVWALLTELASGGRSAAAPGDGPAARGVAPEVHGVVPKARGVAKGAASEMGDPGEDERGARGGLVRAGGLMVVVSCVQVAGVADQVVELS